MNSPDAQAPAFSGPRLAGSISPELLAESVRAAVDRKVPLARVLHYEYLVPRQDLLAALSEHYGCPAIEYDERLPIPPELLGDMPGPRMVAEGWFPVIKDVDNSVVVAAADPADPGLLAAVTEVMGPGRYEFRVTLPDDIAWFVQDYLHAKVGELIGTERTGLAYWRNIMAQWRTRMACYRTDMAKARTALALVRAGLALTTISQTLLRSGRFQVTAALPYSILVLGLLMIVVGTPIYIKVRRSRLTPPRHQTLVEVTAATLMFLENFHFSIPAGSQSQPSKSTMLARLGDFLADYSTIIFPVPASRERTHLARERNVLAAQRTIAGCYRTIYARARTGLAFIRTGVSFLSIGMGLLLYFGLSVNTPFDLILMTAGVMMIVDGLLWYLPVRREQAELPRSRSAALDR
jgi:uncharacterized membrane protein YidH (DUF202 family)